MSYDRGMRLPTYLFALTMLSPALASANDGREDSGPRRARSGGVGFMQLGTHIGPVADVARTLRDPGALGDRAISPSFGYTIGGGGRALLLRRLVIGGRGFGLFTPRVGGDRGVATITAGGGGFELGVAALNSNAWLLIPYVGGGAGGITIEVANESSGSLTIADDEAIPRGGTRTYDAGFGYLEFGLAAHRLLFFGDGGFAVGVDVGGIVSVGPQKWNTAGRNLDGIDRPKLSGAFLRLTIGGGGFSFD